jgi:hypothetical protein
MNFSQKPREPENLSWLWVGLWVLFIYGSIPLARSVQVATYGLGAKMLFLWITFSCAVACCRLAGPRELARRVGLVAYPNGHSGLILGVLASLTWALRASPEEAFHFVQYGVLSFLLFRALSQRISDPSIYLAAVTIGFVFGILDELIQWVVPRRYFDLRDIGINLLSVMLIQLGIAAGIRPAFIRGKMSSSGLTLALWGAIVTLALFALSFTIKTPTL